MLDGSELILTVALVLGAAVMAAAAGERVGAPLLLVFLVVGVLAGAEGPGGVEVADPSLAFAIASGALAVILLDGALRTEPAAVRAGFTPGALLATAGVLATALITALFARLVFDIGWTGALLIGAIVSSTDAAAVFSLIGRAGSPVRPRLAAALEVESGINDPLAVFLTLTLVEALIAGAPPGVWGWLMSLSHQFAGGLVVGGVVGAGAAWLSPRLRVAAGLRPIFLLAAGLLAFGLAQVVGASGFLAVYVAGLVHAWRAGGVNEGEAAALDGFAWLAQITLFLLLGLLVSPSHVALVFAPALALGVALIIVARPVAVIAILAPLGFRPAEIAFASWTGLRGATPIFLGLAPAALGAPGANLYFSIAFVVAVLSLVVQGWTTPFAARFLGVVEAPDPADDPEIQTTSISSAERLIAARQGQVRAGAIVVAGLVAWGALIWFARDVAPAPNVDWRPASVAELEAGLNRLTATPPSSLPADWNQITEQDRARRLFVAVVAAHARSANAQVLAEREAVLAWRDAVAAGRDLTLRDQARRDVMAERYNARYGDLDDLAARVDAVPVSLIVAHAALTTGWGRSEAAIARSNLFAQTPTGEDRGADGAFADLGASVAAHVRRLNSDRALADFRAARAAARANGEGLGGAELADGLAAFGATDQDFPAQLRAVIATSNLAALDASLARP